MSTLLLELNTRQHWEADGVQTVWNFSFAGGYISREHVRAYYEDLQDPPVRTVVTINESSFVGDFQVSITPAVPAGYTLVIYRDSSNGGLPLVDFQDASDVKESNLDIVAKQSVFVAEEASDFLGVTSSSDLTDLAQAALAAAAAAAASATNADNFSDAAAASATGAASSSAAAASSASAAATSAANAASAANTAVNAHKADLASVAPGLGDALLGVQHSGTGSLARTQHARNEDDLHLSDKGTTADMLTALQDVATDFVAGGYCQIEAGTWTLPSTFTFTGQRLHLQGKGRQVSIVSFNPGAADVALEVNEPSAGGSNQGSIGGLGFTSANTQDKTAIRLVNVANWDIGHIGIATNAWQGDSIGVKTEGRQLLYIHDSEIACARPIVIGNNATFPSISADHSLLERLELVGTSATRPCIEFEDGTSFINMTLRNLALVKGAHGIYWNDTTSVAAGLGLLIENIRTEQALSAASYSIYLSSTAQTLQSLTVRNAVLDSGREGILLRNCQRITLDHVDFNMGAGRIALDITLVPGSVLEMRNCFKQAGSTITIRNGRCIRRNAGGATTTSDGTTSTTTLTSLGSDELWVFDSNLDTFSAGAVNTDAYFGGVPFSVPAGGTFDFCDNTFTGYILVVEATENVAGGFLLTGSTQSVIDIPTLDPAGFFSATAGTANSSNVFWNAGTTRFRIQNNRAVTCNYAILRLGTSL